jgi:hypothetical protein
VFVGSIPTDCPMRKPRPGLLKRYRNDIPFRELVKRMADAIRHGTFTVQDFRDALELAQFDREHHQTHVDALMKALGIKGSI